MATDPGQRRKGLVILYTGNGKGKTTAALGLLFRAWGHGLHAIMLQFIKSSESNYGEHRAARKAGIEIVPRGGGFTWLSKDLSEDAALAAEQWELSRQKILSGQYDMVLLDEMTYPVNYGWIAVDDVLETLRERPAHVHVVITGRNAPQPLIDFADLVTEMEEVKHPFDEGRGAVRGIDY